MERTNVRALLLVLIGLIALGCGDDVPEELEVEGEAETIPADVGAPERDPLASATRSPALASDLPVDTVAFGSCLHQERPQEILETIAGHDDLDLMLFLGDNVYGDVTSPELTELREAYREQARSRPLNALREQVPVLATWDDHDYGRNDAGADFEHKEEAEALFERFWHDADAPHADRPGVYQARVVGPPERRVQIILLDTRYFRSPLRATDERDAPGKERYVPSDASDSTLLGETQWVWLEEQLRQPADLRLLVSSIQVIADGHGYEAWRTLPRERERLLELIREIEPRGLVILSGDRHRGGIYRYARDMPYPLYEVTSSSLNLPARDGAEEAGPWRLGATYTGANYGLVDVEWPTGVMDLQIRDARGTVVRERTIELEQLAP